MFIEPQISTREVFERFREAYPELGSINAIAAQSETDFVNLHASKFEGGSRDARQAYRLAVNLKQKSDLLWLNIRDAISPYFQNTLFNNLPTDLPDEFIAQLKTIPAYRRLFKDLTVLQTDHCRSIFGPAAYFVDLLRFIEANITNKITNKPDPDSSSTKANPIPDGCKLGDRRPDLSRIRLDCDNTNELIPYIELVNELLEVFIKTRDTDPEAYELLKDEVFPMHLPYHLPLDEIRSYLKQLKTSLHQIYQTFELLPRSENDSALPDPIRKARITGEALALSPEEFSLIVSELAAPLRMYGEVPLTGAQGLENVDVFLEQTGLTRQELNELIFQDLDRHEINAGLSRLFFINNVTDGLGYLNIALATGNSSDLLLNLSLAKLDRIYRFLKLSRKLGWSFAELDWALRSLHAPYNPETVLLFDGINDYVECRGVKNLDLSVFTIEAWINPADAGRNVIISKGSESDRQLHFMLWINSLDRLSFYGRLSATESLKLESVYTIPTGVFTHVAVVVDETTVKLYINGVSVQVFVNDNRSKALASASLSSAIAPIGTDLNIGRDLYNEHFAGIIKAVRIWAIARSAASIESYRYLRLTGQEQGLVAYWPLTETPSNALLDLTSSGNHGIMGGAQFSTQPRWVRRDLVLDALSVGQGFQFNGVDDYLAANEVTYGDLREITLEAWIKPEARSEKNSLLFKGNRATGASQLALWINGEGKLVFQSASLARPYTSDGSIAVGQLTHICVVLDQEGTSRQQILKTYINGVLDLQEIVTPDDLTVMPLAAQETDRANSYLLVGRSVEGNYFNGVMREIRLWNQPRTAEQIALFLYRSVPTGELGLIGYWRLDRIGSEASGANEARIAADLAPALRRHPLFLGGLAKDHAPDRLTLANRLLHPLPIATTGTVLQFDGDNDVVVIHDPRRVDQRNSRRWGLGQYERFTLEFWFNALDSSLGDRQQILFSQGDAEAGLSVYLFHHQLHVLAWCNNFEGNALQQTLLKSEAIAYQQWQHLAITQNEFPVPVDTTSPLPLEPIELQVYLNGGALPTPAGTEVALGYRLSPVGVVCLGGLGEQGITRFEHEYSTLEVEHPYFFAGQMTDLRLWKTVKTASEIESDRHVAPTLSPDLVAYFPTSEGQGNQIRDCANLTDLATADIGTLQSRNIVFSTDGSGIELENVFSHYYAPDALTWSNYIYTGRVWIDSEDAGIGLTFLSQYPNNTARFYRLQRSAENPQFHLVAHTHGFQPLTILKDAAIAPTINTWYRFRIRVEDTNNQTEIKVLVWEDELENVEPPADAFQIEAIDSSVHRLTQGTVGVWAFGAGKKQFDRLKVERIVPLGMTGETLLVDSNFEPYNPPQDPTGWNPTSDRINFSHNALLFKTVAIADSSSTGTAPIGNNALSTSETLEHMQSFYDAPEALNWSNYVYTGKIRFSDADSGAGISVLSRYPDDRDQCYRLQRDALKSTFYLDARPYGMQPLRGAIDSGVESRPDVWYRFRVEVQTGDTATTLKAKVWEAGTNEPIAFQMEVSDDSDLRILAGTVGVWAGGNGSKFFDDLQVVFLPDILLEENFGRYSPNQDPDGWVDTSVEIDFEDTTPLFKAIADPTNANNIVVGITETSDRDLNSAYSHYANPAENPAVLTWTNYTYSGRFYLADLSGSIGITVFSQFPAQQERCYRLGYEGGGSNTFQIVSVVLGDTQPLSGQSDSGVEAQAGTWFRFQIEIENDEEGDRPNEGTASHRTRIQAKVWPSTTAEPAGFQIDAFEVGEQRLKAGTVGIWAGDRGLKLFDDLRVHRHLLYNANFETTPVGQLPANWRVTKPQGNVTLVKVVDLVGNKVLAAGPEQSRRGQSTEVHAHLNLPESLNWSHYTYTGRFRIDSQHTVESERKLATGGVGISFFSRYTDSAATPRNRDRFYRLRSGVISEEKTFGLRADPGGIEAEPRRRDTSIKAEINIWYRFHVEVYNTATRTEMRAKIWQETEAMPANFQMEGYDDDTPNTPSASNSEVRLPGRITSGTIGVWTEGDGVKYFDDLQVSEGIVLFEDFQALAIDQHPDHWVDTPIRHSFIPTDLFKTVEVDGKTVFGTVLEKKSAHSHYTLPEGLTWTNYTCVGKLRLTDSSGGIGITVLSHYPQAQDRYYRLSYSKTTQFNTFQLVAHPRTPDRLKGVIDSGLTPNLNIWYCFRITVQDESDRPEGGRTTIKAKIWPAGQDEPTDYQVDAYDDSRDPGGNGEAARLTSGTIGVWGAGQGNQYFDEIAVFRQSALSEDFGNDAPGTMPPQWTNVSARSLFETDLNLFETVDVSDNLLHWSTINHYPSLLRPLSRQALQFDGRGEYVAGGLQQPLELTQFTVEAWVNLAAPRASQVEQDYPIFGISGFTPTGQAAKLWFGVTVSATGEQAFKLSLVNVQDQIRPIAERDRIPWDHFVYVAVQLDGDRVTFYRAGETNFADETNSRKLQMPLAFKATRIEIGKDAGTRYFAGQVKEVRLWNIARTLGQEIDPYQRPAAARELVGYWTFDETLGNEAKDASSSGNGLWLGDALRSRNPDLVDLAETDQGFWRSQRQVLGFNGTSQLISILDEGRDTARLRRTIEIWFRVEDKGISDRKQVLYQEGDDQRGLHLYIFDGYLYFGGYNTPPAESDWHGTWLRTDRIQSGKWHHAALVLDGRAEIRPESLRAFLDGRLIDASPGSQLWGERPVSTLGGVRGAVRFHDGVSANTLGHYLRGQLLEVRIWNTARTATQIAMNRMVELQGEPFLALLWVFDGITDQQIRDRSGNRHTAVVESDQLQPIVLPQVATLPETKLDATTLDGLVTIHQLKEQSNLSIDRLVALWHRIKHVGRDDQRTLFDQIFNPPGVVGDSSGNARWEPYPTLRWGKLGQENSNRDRQIRTRLMGALQLSDADLDAIVEFLSGSDPIIDLDHTYLNQLYRFARLSTLLRLGVNDLLRLLNLMQLRSLETLDNVVRLVERADWLALTELTVTDLKFFARAVAGDYPAGGTASHRLLLLTEAVVRDAADSLMRQSRDFLLNSDSFISNEINQAQSIALFDALIAKGYLSAIEFGDGKRAVTSQYQGLSNLNTLFSDPAGGFAVTSSADLIKPHLAQVDALLTRLRNEHKNAILVELATLFETSPDVIQVVFEEYESPKLTQLSAQPQPSMEPIQFLREMQTLQQSGSSFSADLVLYLNTLSKVLSLATRFTLTAAELAVLFEHPGYFSVESVLQPSIADLNSLYQFKAFKLIYHDADGKLLSLLQTTTAPHAERAIVALTGWDARQLERLQSYFGLDRLYNRLADLEQLQQGVYLAQTVQVDVDFLIQLALPNQTFQGYQQLSAATLKVLRAKYTDEQWSTVYKPIRAQIAVNRRDALLSLAMLKLKDIPMVRRDADLLYEYFLLDPQVSGDVETSRIVQATASLQLYIQRCLMNLEVGVDPATIPLQEWEWMKNYRVWEANRKVFLYPENYIEPELRDTKSPLFAELEQELMQSDVNQRSVEQAYTNYLDKFAELANLRIVGSYLRKISPDEKVANAALPDKLLYLIGRTDTQPRIYYYRELHLVGDAKQFPLRGNRPLRWLPWHKIDLTINADNVSPVYAFDRLFLFWAEITKTTESIEVAGKPVNRDVYQPVVKYSYYNFNQAWVQPQTYLEVEEKLDSITINQTRWQRVNVQRSLELAVDDQTTAVEQKAQVLKVAQTQQNGRSVSNFVIERPVSNINPVDTTWSIWTKITDQNLLSTTATSATLQLLNYNNGQFVVSAIAHQIISSSTHANTATREIEQSLIDKMNVIFDDAHLVLETAKATIEQVANNRMINNREATNAVSNLEKLNNDLSDLVSEFHTTLDTAKSALEESRIAELVVVETEIKSLIQKIEDVIRGLRSALLFRNFILNDEVFSGARQTTADADDNLRNAKAQPPKAGFFWGSPRLMLQVGLSNRLAIAQPLSYERWTNIAITLQRQGDSYAVQLYITEFGSTSVKKELQVVSSPALTNGLLKIGKPTDVVAPAPNPDVESRELMTAQLCEFQLWSYAKDEQTIRQEVDQRKDGNELALLVHLPLTTHPNNSDLIVEVRDLNLRRSSFGLLPVANQERMIVFYGTTVGTLRNNLDDLSFNLTLEQRNTQSHYDVTITQSNLHLSTTAGLSMNDFATAGDNQGRETTVTVSGIRYNLRDYNPDYLRSLIRELDQYPSVPVVLGPLITAINAYLAEIGSTDTILLKNLPAFESTVFDVNNQPGWYIVYTKNEQFLLIAEPPQRSPLTVEERLRFEYGRTQTRSAPQPVTAYFENDPVLAVPLTVSSSDQPTVTFKVERLSTFAIHELSQNLFKGGLDALISRHSQLIQEWNFADYEHNSRLIIPPSTSGQTETIDFNGAYGLYYWEIFFHIPFLIANRLNANQNFADAQRWYHYIFDPTTREPANGTSQGDRYWQFVPFRNRQAESLSDLLSNAQTLAEYRNDPFDPHAIARLRLVAYQKAIVMKYIDNLVDWGDQLFTRDTRESINEATMLYVLSYNLLGQRPKIKSVKELREVGTYDDFLREHEALGQADSNQFEFWSDDELALSPGNGANPHGHLITSFTIPENETFIGYWDRVEDRLYKIRHSLNIEGIFRQLALFDPPIDPADLVRAIAGGRDLGSVLNDISAPVPHYRYAYLFDKAKEMVSFVTDLGSSLLEAIEKREAAQLETLLNTHEQVILNLTTQVKRWEIDGAQKQIEQLQINQQRTQEKKDHFEKLIKEDLNTEETAHLVLKGIAQGVRTTGSVLGLIASAAYAVPDVIAGGAGIASPVVLTKVGGEGVGNALQTASTASGIVAEIIDTAAEMTEKIGEYKRRKGEWEHEKKVAVSELSEIQVQLDAAQISLQKSQRELLLHQKAITQTQEIADFHRSKFSNQALYNWMISRLSGLYFQAYKLAYELAKSAEKALQFELPTTDTFVSFGHWDSLKKGLLAGESLMLELNRMDKFHLDRDRRFLEMEKVISLKVSPELGGELQTQMGGKLADLITNGWCEFNLSERLFNEDYPGHYCRLLKTISISIRINFEGMSADERLKLELQSVNAIVTQRSSKTLLQPKIDAVRYLMNAEGEQPEINILRVDWRANQQIAITRAEENSGTFGDFDLNLLFDDRYFPFEGTGAVSSWRLEVSKGLKEFPLNKIDDVVIRLRYTSKSDEGKFKNDVEKEMRSVTS